MTYIKASDGSLYKLDGDLNGPVKEGIFLETNEDVLSDTGLAAIKKHVVREGYDRHFSLLALTFGPDGIA